MVWDESPSQNQNATATLAGSPESDSEFLTREVPPWHPESTAYTLHEENGYISPMKGVIMKFQYYIAPIFIKGIE